MGNRVIAVLLLWLPLSGAAIVGAASATRLPRADEASRCPGFVAFRSNLREIITRKDREALLAIVDPDIKISFGDESGRDDFRKMWFEQAEAYGDVWTELTRVLDLGGRCEDGMTFIAPYVYANWPEDAEPFESFAITGSGVRLRAAPNQTARVIASLDFAIVRAEHVWENPESIFVAVTTPDGRNGFVARRFIRSPVDYRAFFSRQNGVWRLVTFVGGD